jgi:hypothetical protein
MDGEATSTSPMDEVVSSPRGQKCARCDSTEDRDDDGGAGASIDAVKVEEEEAFAEKAGACGFRKEALLQLLEMDAPHHVDDLEQPEDTTRVLTALELSDDLFHVTVPAHEEVDTTLRLGLGPPGDADDDGKEVFEDYWMMSTATLFDATEEILAPAADALPRMDDVAFAPTDGPPPPPAPKEGPAKLTLPEATLSPGGLYCEYLALLDHATGLPRGDVGRPAPDDPAVSTPPRSSCPDDDRDGGWILHFAPEADELPPSKGPFIDFLGVGHD